jgi:hypothetical protein
MKINGLGEIKRNQEQPREQHAVHAQGNDHLWQAAWGTSGTLLQHHLGEQVAPRRRHCAHEWGTSLGRQHGIIRHKNTSH